MLAYDPAEWSDLFVACAGAAAALAGLLFVAISINLERILAYPELPARALETVLLLLGVLVVSIFGLVPEPSRTALGTELLATGGAITLVTILVMARNPGQLHRLPARIILVFPGSALFVIGGISLLAESGGGLYWVLAGIVAGFVGVIINAWVLLVEILR